MSKSHGEIHHVSDTALLVAACRALESESPDGLVQDPFAARLAGDRGMAMFRALSQPDTLRFGIGVRSHFVDELLLEALASRPVSTVLSLGCGLDTRPWRLELPPALRWIEVDFAGMLDYKDAHLASETPRCRRERLAADLNDPAQRSTIYDAAGPSPAIVITEGLLMYLPASTVDALAAETSQRPDIVYWLTDIMTTAFANAMAVDSMRTVRGVQAVDSLPGEALLKCIHRHGWQTGARRSYLTDMAFAMKRIQLMTGDNPRTAGPPPVPPGDPTGVHRFDRA